MNDECPDYGEPMIRRFYDGTKSRFSSSSIYWQCPVCYYIGEEIVVESPEIVKQKEKNRKELIESWADSSDPYLRWLANGDD